MDDLKLSQAAKRAGVSAGTLKRWAEQGVVPHDGDGWSPAAVATARIVARLRDRGHSLASIRRAAETGRLAFGYIEDLFPADEGEHTFEDAARETGLEPALIERVWQSVGFPSGDRASISDDDLQLLRYIAAVLAAGFPLVAFLQLVRVYGQALAQMADAEVRLFHLYVHEPLMRDGVGGLEMAEEMEGLARELLPLSSPIMDHLHQRFLQHFIELDVIGHMEADLEDEALELGRLRVAIAFADLAGYTRMTEEAGEEEALTAVERFTEAVEETLPDDARIIKTIGDEVMVVGSDPAGLTDWAVGFQELHTERPLPRIGIHYGETLYRDGDYYGREVNQAGRAADCTGPQVNQAARAAARPAGGEVLVTRPVVESAGRDTEFDPIGQVRLK